MLRFLVTQGTVQSQARILNILDKGKGALVLCEGESLLCAASPACSRLLHRQPVRFQLELVTAAGN